jgi:hypothetical protein
LAQRHFRVNRPNVICETFDNEVVAVNFETGSYYGMMRTALEIWNFLDAGASEESIVQELASRDHVDIARIRADVRQFLARLEADKLVVQVDPAAAPRAALPRSDGDFGPYQTPQLSVYEDMQDLLLLDPIHDVGESGWPARKPQGPNAE